MIQARRTILIVDDSPEDCEVYRRYLLRDKEYQYTVVTAGLGQEGLALSQQHQPDIGVLCITPRKGIFHIETVKS